MLHASGKVLLNGNLSDDDSVIFPGESIETPPDTYATLVREKSEVLIRPSSRLRITERGVELERGEVLVTTTTGLSVQANRLTITPSANGPAKYEVLDIAESPEVKTYQGSVPSLERPRRRGPGRVETYPLKTQKSAKIGVFLRTKSRA